MLKKIEYERTRGLCPYVVETRGLANCSMHYSFALGLVVVLLLAGFIARGRRLVHAEHTQYIVADLRE